MAKRCIICDGKAEFQIKNSSEAYCKSCTIDQFGDTALLVKVETESKMLKRYLDNAGSSDQVIYDEEEE